MRDMALHVLNPDDPRTWNWTTIGFGGCEYMQGEGLIHDYYPDYYERWCLRTSSYHVEGSSKSSDFGLLTTGLYTKSHERRARYSLWLCQEHYDLLVVHKIPEEGLAKLQKLEAYLNAKR